LAVCYGIVNTRSLNNQGIELRSGIFRFRPLLVMSDICGDSA
jgi:hypothetical protein